MGNTKKNKGYIDKIMPNSEYEKLLILQYNPSDGGREIWSSVAGECVKNGQNSDLQSISVTKGVDADYVFTLLIGSKMGFCPFLAKNKNQKWPQKSVKIGEKALF